MNLYTYIQEKILSTIESLVEDGTLPTGLDLSKMIVELPRDPSHGDLSTNVAMVLTKQIGKSPRDIAALLVEPFATIDGIDTVEVAGPGFINFRVSVEFWQNQLLDILTEGLSYGDSKIGAGEKINVEYVSTNPTGPLHIGHVRGAVYGDALAKLLSKVGYEVTKEYYINDAGAQIDKLARSVYLRYLEALGKKITIPEGLYPGDYLIPVGKTLAAQNGDKWVDKPEEVWLKSIRPFAVFQMMALIQLDLKSIGVEHDIFMHESNVYHAGLVDEAFATLKEKGLIYTGTLPQPKGMVDEEWTPRDQALFKSTDFGDDEDRALQKEDGTWTYFAADAAYHLHKLGRGYYQQINVFGADHGGYVKRLQAVVTALSDGKANLDIILCQMVNLSRGTKLVKVSKRDGNMITLKEVVDEVGADALRFSMLTRKTDTQLTFDFEKVVEKSKDNLIYYIQYAVARTNSVFRIVKDKHPDIDLKPYVLATADLTRLTDEAEIDLIKLMASWPRIVEGAAQSKEPHRIAFYLYDLASAFHVLWNKGNDDASLRFISTDLETTKARLALIQSVALVIGSGLEIMGIEPIEGMM